MILSSSLHRSLLLLLFTTLLSGVAALAQSPKGNRTLAWQIDMAENEDYQTAMNYGLNGCLESLHFSLLWEDIEPDTGQFDQNWMAESLDIMNLYYPAVGIPLELVLTPTNTVVRTVPTELEVLPFDHPDMINGYKRLLDTVFARIPNVELTALNIGNESDVLFGTDASKFQAFQNFLAAVIPHAKALYQQYHGEPLLVGTTLTSDGMIHPDQRSLCQDLNSVTDLVSTTYYPLRPDFTVHPPDKVLEDFDSLVLFYGTINPIYINEAGYPSSAVCNSSETMQAQFFSYLFEAWDQHQEAIPYVTVFKSTDWSQQMVEDLGDYYGIQAPTFLEFLRTLGVRTWPNGGENKSAYNALLCALDARDWCTEADCMATSLEDYETTRAIFYPNPTSGRLAIGFPVGSAPHLLEWVTLNGKTVRTETPNTTTEFTADLSDLNPGIYVLIFYWQDGTTEREILVVQ